MKIIMETIGFRHLRLKTKQERTLYSSPLGCNVYRKTSSLTSLTRNSQLAVLHTRSSQFANLDTTHAPFDLSKATPPCVTYLTFKTFHVIARKQSLESMFSSFRGCSFLDAMRPRAHIRTYKQTLKPTCRLLMRIDIISRSVSLYPTKSIKNVEDSTMLDLRHLESTKFGFLVTKNKSLVEWFNICLMFIQDGTSIRSGPL